MLRIHHLNCGSLAPRFPKVQSVVYCLLVESNAGLVLVDTGFGVRDYRAPTPVMRFFLWLMGVLRTLEETAAQQVTRLGFAVEDVQHIVLTHLHLDHAGGLPDFPEARVHVFRPEYEAAMRPRGLLAWGYVSAHWAHGPRWVVHDCCDTMWFDFEAITVVDDLTPEILLIPLPGHTPGHCGVAVKTLAPAGLTAAPCAEWLLHCGDAVSPFHRAVDLHQHPDRQQPLNIIPDRLVQRLLGGHIPRLRVLQREHREQIAFTSSHDIYSLAENAQSFPI